MESFLSLICVRMTATSGGKAPSIAVIGLCLVAVVFVSVGCTGACANRL